jgi:hypothetical protein
MINIEQFLMSLRTHKDADGKLNPIYLADTIQKEIEIVQEAIKHSQRWVGLTDEEIDHAAEQSDNYASFIAGALFAQDKLEEKNGG